MKRSEIRGGQRRDCDPGLRFAPSGLLTHFSPSPSEYLTPPGACLSLVASTGTYTQSGASSGGLAARAPGNTLIAAAILGLFVLAAVVSAARKDISQGFDEVAHVSYVAQIQHDGEAAPALPTMRLLDPRTFQFTGAANYLNHPPLYYALLAHLGPKLEGDPHALLAYRLINIAIAALGFAALLGLGIAARWPRLEFYAYAVPLGCIPVLVPLAGAVNNDNLAFCGGAIALLGVWQLLATGRESWLALALLGVVLAGWAKLTGLLLTAGLVSGVIAYMVWRKQLPWTRTSTTTWTCIVAVVLVFAIAAAPYVEFILRYGSPTPETPAQIALLTDGARAAGWSDLPRQSFPALSRLFHRRVRRRLDADARRPQRPELRGARHPGGGAGLRSPRYRTIGPPAVAAARDRARCDRGRRHFGDRRDLRNPRHL